ncbi:hypothetical protein TorRG33x02_135970 [Trema orientale]|uniref:Uncharacterized protein n=1 Tax=Trema orientale TaxID=63057 RepID=A0A2P5EYC6_TREOI|nr:hypothetical protein TorRG33x02_135970 [Trema orientale]
MGSDNYPFSNAFGKEITSRSVLLGVGCRHSSIKTNLGTLHFPVGDFTWKKNTNYKKSYKYKLYSSMKVVYNIYHMIWTTLFGDITLTNKTDVFENFSYKNSYIGQHNLEI